VPAHDWSAGFRGLDRAHSSEPRDFIWRPLAKETYVDQHPLIAEAVQAVSAGGLVIVATETFYALAADPFHEDAVRRIFRIKGRPDNKPLPLIAWGLSAVDAVAECVPAATRRLMDRFWPGSLTILLEPTVLFSAMLLGPTGKIGVRIPPPCAARDLAGLVGGLITATSANLSGDREPDEVPAIAASILDQVDVVVDVGRTPGGKPSTVVEPLGHGVRIIRDGAIPGWMVAKFAEGLVP
jgi:L-threonylcarbamoyladenylate synthase